MVPTPQMYLSTHLLDVVLPEGLAFVHPEEVPTHHDENALNEFLREFEENHDLLEVVGLFSVDFGE